METVDLSLEVRIDHDRSILVFDGDNEEWLPKSQITGHENVTQGETVTIAVPVWLATERGLI